METPTQAISGFFLATTPISYGGDHGHATGFFLKRNGTTYLITNKHVVDFTTHNDNSLETDDGDSGQIVCQSGLCDLFTQRRGWI